MSIDTRLRSGLRAEADQAPPVEVVDSWAAVVERAEGERTRRVVRVGAALVAAAAAAALIVVVMFRPGDDAPSPTPQPSPSVSQSPDTEVTEAAEPSAAEGKWRAGPASAQLVVDHLEAAGLGQWTTAVLEGTRPDQQVTYDLSLTDGDVVFTKIVDDGAGDVVDVERYEVRGDRLVFRAGNASCRNILGWRVTGETLQLDLVDNNCPDFKGAPDRAYIEALYGALPFTRLD